jgi:hypothetical protein
MYPVGDVVREAEEAEQINKAVAANVVEKTLDIEE